MCDGFAHPGLSVSEKRQKNLRRKPQIGIGSDRSGACASPSTVPSQSEQQYGKRTTQVAPFFLDSCKDAGIPLTDDFNKPGGREGAGYYHFAVKKGIRDSAARALLGDVIMRRDVRTNLDILTGSQVNRVLLTGGDEVRTI